MRPSDTEIREGDYWEFSSNSGVIPREIITVGHKLVSYRNASGKERVCTIGAFKRWATGASLEFRRPDGD